MPNLGKRPVSCTSAPAFPAPCARRSSYEQSSLWDLGKKKPHTHKCKYLAAADQLLSRHANLRLGSSCITCLGVPGNQSSGSQLLGLAAGHLEHPPSPGRAGKGSRK